jgi:hypothetical protein
MLRPSSVGVCWVRYRLGYMGRRKFNCLRNTTNFSLTVFDHEGGGRILLRNIVVYQVACCYVPKDNLLAIWYIITLNEKKKLLNNLKSVLWPISKYYLDIHPLWLRLRSGLLPLARIPAGVREDVLSDTRKHCTGYVNSKKKNIIS